eukprot:10537691-Alexandrium_andersonii.AAC.1
MVGPAPTKAASTRGAAAAAHSLLVTPSGGCKGMGERRHLSGASLAALSTTSIGLCTSKPSPGQTA